MYIFITLKQTQDKHQQSCDTLEHHYIDYLKAHPLTPQQAVFIPVPNHLENTKQLLHKLKPACFVFTGGNNLNPKDLNVNIEMDDLALRRDKIEQMLYAHAMEQKIPLLAICRGFQHTNVLAGGCISPYLKNHPAKPHFCFYQAQKFQINSYHTHGVFLKDLSPSLTPIVMDEKQQIVEGYVEKTIDNTILGVQWHPERPQSDETLFTRLYEDFLRRGKLINR